MNKGCENLLEILEIRSFLKNHIVEYIQKNNWLEVTASTITSLTGACETISTVFILPYFDTRIHLAQTAQLQLEFLVKQLQRKVWTFDHSFRAEHRITSRHLAEFSLIEMEAPGFKLNDIIATQENILKHCIDMTVTNRGTLPNTLKQRIPYLESIKFPLRILEYTEAMEILKNVGFNLNIGSNLGMEEEYALLMHFNKIPFFIVHYPADIKYFNMKRMENRQWVYSVDLIAPPFGEVSGGAEREDDFKNVELNLKTSQMWKDIQQLGYNKDHFEWYLDLWKDGSPGPRGGFGIGFERLVGFFTGIDDIRQCIEFPRNSEVIFP
jgi:asparaginyl-tRNA synthetase